EIRLVDLATHHSGLHSIPDNFRPADWSNPYADYGPQQLYAFFAKRGFARDPDAGYSYSNLGAGLLGHALALQAGKSFSNQLRSPKKPSKRIYRDQLSRTSLLHHE